MIPYNSQNNDALIKELKFALKSAGNNKIRQKIYPRAGFAVQKAEVVEQLKTEFSTLNSDLTTNINKHFKCF